MSNTSYNKGGDTMAEIEEVLSICEDSTVNPKILEKVSTLRAEFLAIALNAKPGKPVKVPKELTERLDQLCTEILEIERQKRDEYERLLPGLKAEAGKADNSLPPQETQYVGSAARAAETEVDEIVAGGLAAEDAAAGAMEDATRAGAEAAKIEELQEGLQQEEKDNDAKGEKKTT